MEDMEKQTMKRQDVAWCPQCKNHTETYWDLAVCDKNPDGLTCLDESHGNVIGGVITCEDGYCNPDTVPVEPENVNPEYLSTHETARRCVECHDYLDP